MTRLGERCPSPGDVAWIAAPRSDLGPIVDEVRAARLTAPVRVDGRRLDADEPGAALAHVVASDVVERLRTEPGHVAPARDALLTAVAEDGAGWLLVTEPQWLDASSARVVAKCVGRIDGGVVVVAAAPPEGMLATAVLDAGTILEAGALDDGALDDSLAAFDDDPVALGAVIAARSGSRAFLADAIVADLRAAAIEAPGPVIDEASAVGATLHDVVSNTLGRLGAGAALALAAATSDPLVGDLLTAATAEGVVDPRGRLLPAVADVVLAAMTPTDRRARIDAIVGDHVDGTRTAVDAATAIIRVGGEPADAPAVFAAAATASVDDDPERARAWLEAVGDHADPASVLRAMVGCGHLADAARLADRLLTDAEPSTAALAHAVAAAGLQRSARFDDAAATYARADPDDRLAMGLPSLAAVPEALCGTVPATTATASAHAGSLAAARLAGAAAHLLHDDERALAELAATDELAARTDIALWPDTSTGLAALLLSARGEHAQAAAVLGAAPDGRGTTMHQARHAAIGGWVALRAGRWADATAVVDDLRDRPLGLRDRFAVAALDVALLHRGGDADALASAVEVALALVRRHPIDLSSIPAHAEVALACARLGMAKRSSSLLDQLRTLTDRTTEGQGLRHLVDLTAALAGLLTDDEPLVRAGAAGLVSAPVASIRGAVGLFSALADALVPEDSAPQVWAMVDDGAVLEAAIVAGQAALAATDGTTAAPLLKTAREIRARLPRRGADESIGIGALSDRELEIARLVVDGHTYKEIGAQLFISAKTVEHHVAHIRTKLGVSSRAEMLSTLRAGLDG